MLLWTKFFVGRILELRCLGCEAKRSSGKRRFKNRVVSIGKIVDGTKWHFVRGGKSQADIFPPGWPPILVIVSLFLGLPLSVPSMALKR